MTFKAGAARLSIEKVYLDQSASNSAIMSPVRAHFVNRFHKRWKALLTFAIASLLSAESAVPAQAAASAADSKGPSPAGTLLLPLTPKLDTPHEQAAQKLHTPIDSRLEYDVTPLKMPGQLKPQKMLKDGIKLKPEPEKISPESGKFDASDLTINEDTTLKGTIQIVADDTEYDQAKNTFLGTGNAVAVIADQNSKLEADMILYDQNTQMIDARGNVRIIRNGQLTTGSSFKFKVTSDEYLITNPDTEVNGTTVIARSGYGTKDGLAFKSGTVTMDKPIYFGKNQWAGPIGYTMEMRDKMVHPDAYLPHKPSFKFKARKMVYERYKESGNVTVYGGRMMFGKLGIPLPKFEATIGKDDSVVFPVTPYIGNNMMSGGLNLGPMFHRRLGKLGTLDYAPLVQLGGRRLEGETSTNGGIGDIGVGGQLGFTGKRLQAHLAYGSNSNLLVGDLKYTIYKRFRLQSGINRFLDDGLFGWNRARSIVEVVDDHRVGGIPFISGVNFRTSFGWAKDNPQLLQLTPQYAELFNQPKNVTVMKSGFRLQEQISASTHPLFSIGNDKYGLSSTITGGLALRAYSTGDAMAMAQVGPVLQVALNRLHARVGYNQSAVRGESPFVFDQFIQGKQSTYVAGDFKVSKYLTLGGAIGYNLNEKLAYTKSLTAAIGPEDFKVLLTRDFLRGTNRFGFDVLYGQPIPFNRLVLKGRPDHGQLGGI